MKIKLYLVIDHEGEPRAAYPREIQAKVYASGFSKVCKIVKGDFITKKEVKP